MNVKSANRGVKVNKNFLGIIKITKNAKYSLWLRFALGFANTDGYAYNSSKSVLTRWHFVILGKISVNWISRHVFTINK